MYRTKNSVFSTDDVQEEEKKKEEIPCWSSGQDSSLPLLAVRFDFFEELRSHKLHGTA